ncbi:MAG: hypothetical protein DWP97_08295 [Calditrichaeota bacterium]|nr:MAG: hypothetical protein DWP97_08295 [Calditrichota bacterium]
MDLGNIKKMLPKNKSATAKNNVAVNTSIERIYPNRYYNIGKILTFSFDHNSVIMSVAKHVGYTFKLIEVKKEYFPNSLISENGIEPLITNVIKEFTDKHLDRFSKINIALSGEDSLYRTFSMPVLPKKELHSAVHFEVKKLIPFPIERCIYDFRVIEKTTKFDTQNYKISLHAATIDNIQKHLEPFHNLNLRVDHIYHSQDTIGQLLSLLKDFSNDNQYIMLNISRQASEISFYDGTTLEFSRTSSLSSEMLGSAGEGSSQRYDFFAESIANEIQNSLDYYTGQYNSNISGTILVYGDLAYSDELLQLLNDKLDANLERFPFDRLNITYAQDTIDESLPVCLPAIATSVNNSYLPDLLPHQLKNIRKLEKNNRYIKFAASFVIVVLGLFWGYFHNSIADQKDIAAITKNQIKIFENSEIFHTYNMIKHEIALNQNYMKLTQKTESYLHLNMLELSRITPDKIKLFHTDYNPFNNDESNYFVQGTVVSTDIPPEITLAEFVEQLEASPFYDNVKIVRHVKKKDKDRFEIEFLLKMRSNV